jgi:hypothetical protein
LLISLTDAIALKVKKAFAAKEKSRTTMKNAPSTVTPEKKRAA